MQEAIEQPKRVRGRPRSTSREEIVLATLAMLQQGDFVTFTMSKLAKRVAISPMALYTYFTSRDAVLDAVADHIFSQLELPPQQVSWEAATLDWINALYSHFERFPVAFRLIIWDQHVSPAWADVWLPMIRILAGEGLRGRQLAFAATWLADILLGIIRAHCSSLQNVNVPSIFQGKSATPDDNKMLASVYRDFRKVNGREILDFGSAFIISSLKELIMQARASAPRARADGKPRRSRSR